MGFIASAILSPLCKRLINTALQEYELVRDVKEEVGKLRFTVSLIQEVLQDAEQKQVKDDVRYWLRSLKQLLYDAEDILDEAATDSALETRRVEDGTRSVNSIFGCGSIDEILSRRDLAHQIKHIRMKLDEICKEKDALGLQELLITSDEDIFPAAVNTKRRRLDTSSLLMADKPRIVGRDDEKRKIIQMLMGSELEYWTSEPTSNTNNNVHVLSLVGMGGVGKTTLAKLVFNDPTVKQHFHVMIWVCVSENFDVKRITKEILEVISPDQQKESFEILMNLDSAQRRLKAKIEEKKFLLVLDDVWEQDPSNWESLCDPLTYGDKGSRIIVTTRNQRVSDMVKAFCIPLKSLSDEDLWPILKSYAFDGGSKLYGHVQLESIGRRMVKKLKGSPLAAKTIGRLLNRSLDVRHWKNILDSEIFLLEQHSNDISPVLKLSYDHLPGHLKQCFAYCSLFPKDYKFSRFELAQHWVAQNFIQTPRGDQHFDDLLDMSFFEKSMYERYVMHDLIHDLAESISQDDCFRLGDGVRPNEFPEAIRHLSIAAEHLDPMKLNELCKYGKLRTLHFLSQPRFDLSPHLDNLFTKLKRLRVLGLRDCGISELPTSIGNLKHLRFVDLTNTHISKLPESFCGLHNLQVLKLLFCCELRVLPGNTSALVNLMHLGWSDHELVSSIQDLGKLTALQELNIRGVKAKELGDMTMLRHLRIRNLEQVTGKEEAAQARLDAKKYLETLTLEWYHPSLDDHGALEEEEGVLEGLQPVDSITELVIRNYGGVRSPRWLEDPAWVSSSFLERVELTHCKNWEVLPPLGQLRGLKYLSIYGMSSMRWIDPLFFLGCYSPGQGGAFPSLESLTLQGMPEWEEWEAPHHGDDDEEGQQQQISFLPRLHTLEISDCPKLKELPPLPRSLKSLKIRHVGLTRLPRLGGCCSGGGGAGRDADHMSSSSASSPSLSQLSIHDCPNLRSLNDGDDDDEEGQQQQISFLPRLHTLEISDCPKLKELPPLPRSLKSLNIRNVGLTRMPRLVGCCGGGGDGAGRDADHMSSPFLSELCIDECPNLRSLNDGLLQHPLPRLSSLSIRDCRELTSLPDTAFAHFTSLKRLEISDCPKLSSSSSSLPSVSTADEANMPCSLEQVDIIDGGDMMEYLLLTGMRKLTCLSELRVSVGSSSTAQLLLNGILQYQSVTATLRTLVITRDHRHQQHQACSSSSNIPSLIVPPAPPPPPLDMEKVVVGPTNNLRDHLTSLTCLIIRDCSDLLQLSGLPSSLERMHIFYDTHLDDGILATYLQGLCRLTHLDIVGCPHITSLPTAEVLCHLTALQELTIRDCRELMSWGGGVHNLIALQTLFIEDCPNIQCLPSVGLPKSLRNVSID